MTSEFPTHRAPLCAQTSKLPLATAVAPNMLCLPSYHALTGDRVPRVVQANCDAAHAASPG